MSIFVGAYWGARAEQRQACAARIAEFLHAVSELDPTLSQWFKKGASRRAASTMMQIDPTGIEQQLKSNKRDLDNAAIPELGFSFSAWNGREVSIFSTCGAHSAVVRNNLVLDFGSGTVPVSELLEKILQCAVVIFEPQDAIATSTARLSTNAAIPVWDSPAFYRYKTGVGFSGDAAM